MTRAPTKLVPCGIPLMGSPSTPQVVETLSYTLSFPCTILAFRRPPADTFEVGSLGVWVTTLGEARETPSHYSADDELVPGHTGGPWDVYEIDYPDLKRTWHPLVLSAGRLVSPLTVSAGDELRCTYQNVGEKPARFVAMVEVGEP